MDKRITLAQKYILVQEMQQVYEFISSKCNDAVKKERIWGELRHKLKTCGPDKTVAEWRKCWNDLRKSIRIKIRKIKEHRDQPNEPILTEIQSKLTEHDYEIFKLDPESFGIDDDDNKCFQELLVPIEIKAEYDEAHGHEMIDLNDGDIEIIEPTGSAGSYYVTNFDSEFDEPRNKRQNVTEYISASGDEGMFSIPENDTNALLGRILEEQILIRESISTFNVSMVNNMNLLNSSLQELIKIAKDNK